MEELYTPDFQVVKENGVYFVRDVASETNYGRYETKSEAERAMQDWQEYYSS